MIDSRGAAATLNAAGKSTAGRLGAIGAIVALAVVSQFAREFVGALVAPAPARADESLHDTLVKQVAEMKTRLPRLVDDVTTLRDIKVEDLKTIYVAEIRAGYEIDVKSQQDEVTRKFCASTARKAQYGASYRFEYWSAGADSQLLGAFEIHSCP